jgi:hypothetical protein
MRHQISIRGAIKRDMQDFKNKDNNNKKRRKHFFRSASSQQSFLNRLHDYGMKLTKMAEIDGVTTLQSVKSMHGLGMKNKELKESIPHTIMETEINAKVGGRRLTNIKKVVKGFSITKLNNLSVVPDLMDVYAKAADKLPGGFLKKELLKIYKADIEKCKIIKTLDKGDDESTPDSLLNIIVPYWRSIEYLPPIIEKGPKREKYVIIAEKINNSKLVEKLKEYYLDGSEEYKIINSIKPLKATLVEMIVKHWKANLIDPKEIDF